GGNPNSLMTHAFGLGEAIHQPGPITRGIMADIGWQHLYINFEALRDQEEVTPLLFEVSIDSDIELDTTSLFVYFSLDSFQNHVDSLPLIAADKENFYFAQYIPDDNITALYYYIAASDTKTRTYSRPTDAPDFYFSIKFGPDTQAPVIIHEQIEYYFVVDKEPTLSAFISDNIAIDTVYVTYSVNDGPQKTFAMQMDTLSMYKGTFNFGADEINDGDIIHYSIIAKDASSNANTAKVPQEGTYQFRIEEEFSAKNGYVNDFEGATSDFILSDFSIYRASGFENIALHSPHPYTSPEMDDSVFNFTTILKHPIILQNGGKMTYDEIVLVEPGSPGTLFGDENFWDYVVVEGTKNGGIDWYPLADGYDSRENELWEDNYVNNVKDQISSAIGTPEWYVSREIDLVDNEFFDAGDTILIRFRLFSDPYANGWGWAIDNLRIQFPVSVQETVLSPGNINIYPNPFDDNLNVEILPRTDIRNIQIDVYNLYGQTIKSVQHLDATNYINAEISFNDATSGVYLLIIRENGLRVFTKKIIKQ
ncbi:MAG TPA: T9SS type A sorting domain-containing protein, partial [Prolixibacteraceae bacterium]|nr:T9SS type A sorting domain-containing protein [Prolixibacteraceae bacterium]